MSNRERSPGAKPETKPETKKRAVRVVVSERGGGRYDITYYHPTSGNQDGNLLDAGLTAADVVTTLGEKKAKQLGFSQKKDGSWTRWAKE